MYTFIFVHGIGVRAEDYFISFSSVTSQLRAFFQHSRVVPCNWGTALGTPAVDAFQSVAKYADTGGGQPPPVESHDAFWRILYTDPLAELRLVADQPSDGATGIPAAEVQQTIRERIQTLGQGGDLALSIRRLDLDAAFRDAKASVIASREYDSAITSLGENVAWQRGAFARAILATMIVNSRHDGIALSLEGDANSRHNLLRQLELEIYPEQAGITTAATTFVTRVCADLARKYALRHAGSLVDHMYRYLGDVLKYQSLGASMRRQLLACLDTTSGPTVVIGHSLGGVIAFETFLDISRRAQSADSAASQLLGRLPLLVTVGSQAPFLAELDVLSSLRYTDPLPDSFPSWLNLYDLDDLLSFLAFPVFKRNTIRDVQIDSGQPFPQSHSAYWSNPRTYKLISEALGNPESQRTPR